MRTYRRGLRCCLFGIIGNARASLSGTATVQSRFLLCLIVSKKTNNQIYTTMKTKTILFLFLLISGMMSAQVKRVAILETVDKENKVTYANKLMLRTSLSKAITNTPGYEAYDRTDIDAIMGEQDFQRTGLVSNEQIKRLGEMTGVNYILVAEAVVVDSKNMFITAKLLDVETARTMITDYVTMGTDINSIQNGCAELAKKMFYTEEQNKTKEKPNTLEAIDEPIAEVIQYSKKDQKLLGIKEFSYGDIQMDEKAFYNFLRRNSPEAYRTFVNGEKLITAGWWTFGAGLAAMLGPGVACFVLSKDIYNTGLLNDNPFYYDENGGYKFMVVGATFMGIGGGVILSSFPILGVGYKKKKNVIYSLNNDSYIVNNNSATSKPAISLNLQAGQNGIGLALNF